ncbi:bacterial peptide chain release factor 3 (bRF-3) [Natronincola peptidivorans]|uniref:Peptide chain release factor 3 n=1 Tax=Natronincola peptidivorans TaxID=426128 RepID=A0A1I0CA51_9FIRM|nr:peptide chain release factor 3 [Natronincola peptidivorans]SET16128.1 bacterial peptide chain release factor 3 (bRF-3) [Natronincola peptidivorans]
MQEQFLQQVRNRRTFAIISHPDAGKTTLTEKLLLYGGAIRLAGSVKSRRAQKHAVSDWMEIEKQRGISVTSSVLQFDYNGYCINILDTPGHQDFSEDTYRTLVAADSAVMVIDCAKGVEAQTKKLFQVCKMRGIPIFTFINKLDRAGKDPFELMEEIENVLGIRSYPMNWPIGTDGDFKGVYNRSKSQIEVFSEGKHGQTIVESVIGDVNDDVFQDLLGTNKHQQLMEEIELLDVAGDNFDLNKVLKGELTPVFFGSAMTNFGVRPFLEAFLEMTTPPTPRNSQYGEVDPESDNFTGFVFKIQANMNPAHRDRIAFIRICSGKFQKGMAVNHVRINKSIKLAQPQQFLAQDRVVVEEAYPGDIIGVHDPGIFNIGDTLCQDNSKIQYEGIPVFAPEHFAKVYAKDSMKRKQFLKGIEQLSEEGAIQVFKRPHVGVEELIVGVVGVLQFEVLQYRLEREYGVEIKMQTLSYKFIRWIEQEGFDFDRFSLTMDSLIVEDKEEKPVVLFENEWSIQKVEERNQGAVLKSILKKDTIEK